VEVRGRRMGKNEKVKAGRRGGEGKGRWLDGNEDQKELRELPENFQRKGPQRMRGK
jgi:hypothetical protein